MTVIIFTLMFWPCLNHSETSFTESHSLLANDLREEFGRIISISEPVYPLAKETPILEESLFLLKKSSKHARS
jgi:hypothetical protein